MVFCTSTCTTLFQSLLAKWRFNRSCLPTSKIAVVMYSYIWLCLFHAKLPFGCASGFLVRNRLSLISLLCSTFFNLLVCVIPSQIVLWKSIKRDKITCTTSVLLCSSKPSWVQKCGWHCNFCAIVDHSSWMKSKTNKILAVSLSSGMKRISI